MCGQAVWALISWKGTNRSRPKAHSCEAEWDRLHTMRLSFPKGNMITPRNSMPVDPLLYFVCCELSLLIRSNAEWNTMTVGKAFFKLMDHSFGRGTACRESKSVRRVSL